MGAKMQGHMTFLAIDDIHQSNHAICIKVSSMHKGYMVDFEFSYKKRALLFI